MPLSSRNLSLDAAIGESIVLRCPAIILCRLNLKPVS